MLEIIPDVRPVTVALDACGGNVMLSLRDVDGVRFRQALNAADAGTVLGVCNAYSDVAVVCGGDLTVTRVVDGGLAFRWPYEGDFGVVHMKAEHVFVFEEALKSYCRLLMRSPEDLP